MSMKKIFQLWKDFDNPEKSYTNNILIILGLILIVFSLPQTVDWKLIFGILIFSKGVYQNSQLNSIEMKNNYEEKIMYLQNHLNLLEEKINYLQQGCVIKKK